MFPAILLSLAAAHPVYFWLIASLVIIVIIVVLCGLGWFLYNYVLDNLELYDPEQPFHTLVTREIMPRSLLLPRLLNFGHPVRRGTLLFWLQERIDHKWRNDPALMEKWFEWLWQYGEEPVPTPPTKFQVFKAKLLLIFDNIVASMRPRTSQWDQFKNRLRTKFNPSLSSTVSTPSSFKTSGPALFDAEKDFDRDLEKAMDLVLPVPALVKGAAIALPPSRARSNPALDSIAEVSESSFCSTSDYSQDSIKPVSLPIPNIHIVLLAPSATSPEAHDAADAFSPVLNGLTPKPEVDYLQIPECADECEDEAPKLPTQPKPTRRTTHAQRRPKAAPIETLTGPRGRFPIRPPPKPRSVLAPVSESITNSSAPSRTRISAKPVTARQQGIKPYPPTRTPVTPTRGPRTSLLYGKENNLTQKIPVRPKSKTTRGSVASGQISSTRRPWV